MDWVEERCEAIRLALGIAGFPGEHDLWRLADWLSGPVEIRHADVATASWARGRDGRSVVVLPERACGRLLDSALAHEIGHALLSVGMGPLLRQMAAGDRRSERLARIWDAQDERRAVGFVLAWHLPSCWVQALDDDELVERSGCSSEMVRTRRERLAGQVHQLRHVPAWSAWWSYHIVAQAGPPAVVYAAARGGFRPEYVFPSTVDPARLAADLVALTPEEWDWKHACMRAGALESRQPTLDELRRQLCLTA